MPTENRSSNTEMVSVPRDLIDLALAHLPNDSAAKWEIYEVLARPDPQPHPEPASYPPCDYCRTVPSYHPWHGSGMLNGVENRHIHACDGCRWQLPSHPGQPHAEPIAWMVGTAIWWSKAEAERDSAEVGMPVIALAPLLILARLSGCAMV